MKLTIESLEYAKSIYLSWAALTRAGYGAEIMHYFAHNQLNLTQYDRDEMCRVFWTYGYDTNGWDLLVKRFA